MKTPHAHIPSLTRPGQATQKAGQAKNLSSAALAALALLCGVIGIMLLIQAAPAPTEHQKPGSVLMSMGYLKAKLMSEHTGT
jgi:hypothetical protein